MTGIGDVLGRVRNAAARSIFRLPRTVQRRLAGAPIVVDGKTLDVEMQLMLRLQRLEDPPVDTLPLAQARRQVVSSARLVGGKHPIDAVADRTIDGPGGPIGLRFYTPRDLPGGASPTLVYLRGGSFMHGDLDSHDPICLATGLRKMCRTGRHFTLETPCATHFALVSGRRRGRRGRAR